MKASRSLVFLLILTIVAILCAGCTSTSQPVAVVTTAPTDTDTPTAVPTAVACAIENSHGLTVKCGPNPAPVNAMDNTKDPGDRCRQYASCQVVSGSCQLVTETKYTTCASCIKQCESSYYNNPNMMDDCAEKC